MPASVKNAPRDLTGRHAARCMPERMKKLLFPIVMLAAASVLPVHAEEHSPLSKEMGALDDAYKGFRKETDPVKGAEEARKAQEAVIKSLPFIPSSLSEEKDPEAKAKLVAEYKRQMGQMYVTLCEVEAAFLAKDLDKVAKLVDTLKGEKKEGHGKFIKEEE